ARIVAALLYGSWTAGEADEHSDLEAYVFVAPGQEIDPRAFAEQIAPVRLCHTNMFGVHSIVFDDLMRGEFHFDPADEIDKIASWQGMIHLPYPNGPSWSTATAGSRNWRTNSPVWNPILWRPPSSRPTNWPTGRSWSPTCSPAGRPHALRSS